LFTRLSGDKQPTPEQNLPVLSEAEQPEQNLCTPVAQLQATVIGLVVEHGQVLFVRLLLTVIKRYAEHQLE
jgi:hypothetical protein